MTPDTLYRLIHATGAGLVGLLAMAAAGGPSAPTAPARAVTAAAQDSLLLTVQPVNWRGQPMPASTPVAWVSSAPAVARVVGTTARAVVYLGAAGQATVTASWDAGHRVTLSKAFPITVTAPLPVARFTPACSGLACAFDGRASTGVKLTYAWTCGAAPGCAGRADPQITFTYPAAGTYGVTLTVTDSLGRAAKLSKVVTVAAPAPAPTPAAPVARLAVSCAGLTCTLDGRASTGARLTYAWDCGAFPNCGAATALVTFTYPHGGDRTAALAVTDSLGRTASASLTFPVTAPVEQPPPPPSDTTPTTPPPPADSGPPAPVLAAPAELPRAVPAFAVPAPARTVRVPAGGDLQAALDAAQGGDDIVLAAGATYTGNFRLPTRPCAGWVTVRSDVPAIARGTRVDTVTAKQFAKIVTTNSGRALEVASPSCQWQLTHVEVVAAASAGVPDVSLNYGIVWSGNGGWVAGGENQVSLAQVPQQIIFDHVWIHGSPTTNTTRCLKLDSGNTIVRDSRLSDCHALGSDSQAILGCNGPGPFLIENNFLSGAGENVMFGGCDPADSTLIPSDITFRRNHVWKDPAWKGVWTAKNPLEFKNARRALVEGNVFENSWTAAQLGMCLVIKSSTETSPVTWEGTKDVTVRWNVFRSCHRGLNVQAIDGSSAGTTASHTERVTVEQNLFADIGTSNGVAPSDGWLMLLTHDLKDLAVRHNTFVSNTPGYGLCAYFTYSGGGARRIDLSDNVCAGLSYYALAGDGGNHTAALTGFAGTSWSFQRNAVAQVDGQFVGLNPSTSWYVPALAGLGLAPDYSLLPTSPFKGRGWDGTDPGADIAELLRRTAGVVVR